MLQVTLVIVNVELENELNVLTSYMLYQLFISNNVESIVIVTSLRVSELFAPSESSSSSLPLYYFSLFSSSLPFKAVENVHQFQPSSPLNDSFLAKYNTKEWSVFARERERERRIFSFRFFALNLFYFSFSDPISFL